MKLALIASTLCCLLLAVSTKRHPFVLNNGLAQPRIEHIAKETQYAPRCVVQGKPLNLLIILDSSGSLRDKFEEERDVVQDIIKTVAIHPDYTRIALVQYSGIARTEFNFNVFNSTSYTINQRNMHQAVEGLRFINGITKTGNAVQHAMTLLDPKEGWRPNVKTIAFIVSDGRTYDSPRDLDEKAAKQIQARGVDLYAYGTGEYVAIEELVDMTGSDQKVFSKSKQIGVKLHIEDMINFFSEWEGQEVCEEVPICIPGSDKPADLLFVVDGSGSLKRRFDEEVQFLHRIIKPINVHPEAVRVGVIQYAKRPKKEFGFMEYQSAPKVEEAIDRIKYISGSTDTNAALDYAVEMLRTDPGRRPGVQTVVVVLTDGHSRFPIDDSAQRLLATADHVYAIAVNALDLVDTSELYPITKDWKRVYMRGNLTEFEYILNEHFSFNCPGLNTGGQKDDFEPVVRGPVDLKCSRNGISLQVRTRQQFEGRMYAVGHYNEPGCFLAGDGARNELSLNIPGDRCGIKRKPEADGYRYTGLVMLQFHPSAVTKVDQILDISCFHKDTDARSKFGQLNLKLPSKCQYNVRKFAPNGCVALDARVGETLYHSWECDNDATQYGFLVHTCFVEGNDGSKIALSDSKGCALDNVLFGTPTYLTTKGVATYESSSFRMPQADNIRFRCQISFCDRAVGACDHVLPPQCPAFRAKRAAAQSNLPRFEVVTKWLSVLDSELAKPTEPVKFCNSYIR